MKIIVTFGGGTTRPEVDKEFQRIIKDIAHLLVVGDMLFLYSSTILKKYFVEYKGESFEGIPPIYVTDIIYAQDKRTGKFYKWVDLDLNRRAPEAD